MEFSKRNKDLLIDLSLLLFAFILLWLIRGNIIEVVGPFIVSLVIAYLLDPLVLFFQRRKLSRIISIIIVFVIILAVVLGIFASFIPKLVSEIGDFVVAFPNIVRRVVDFIEGVQEGTLPYDMDRIPSFIDLEKELANLSEKVVAAVGAITTSIISGTGKLLDLIMIPIITFYYLKDKDDAIGIIASIIPNKYKGKVKSIAEDISKVLGGFIRGQLIVATFVGLLTGIGCALIGLPYSLTIGVVAGFTNVIPYFGPWLGGILPVSLALIVDPVKAIWVIVLILIVQQIESNFLSPQIMSQSVGLHPLAVMFSVLLFGNIFGIVGMIIGVPIVGTIKVLVGYIRQYRRDRNYIDHIES